MEIVNSHNVEFGYELISAVPYAYYLHTKGLLSGTVSASGSESIYYFSPDHKINPSNRMWSNMDKAIVNPNTAIHQHYIDFSQFKAPEYKNHFKNDTYKYDKPIVCICNRYNIEWRTHPINFFSLECLDNLFNLLKKDYQIIYFAVDLPENLQDDAHSMELGDREFIKENHPEVLIFKDLLGKKDWNTELLRIFANTERFITMNGGYSILASFFGGKNIIYSKPGVPQTKEILFGSFWRWYPQISNSQTVYVYSYENLIERVKDIYIDSPVTVNVLVRTCKRLNFFNDCIKSIQNQTYKNINIIVGVEKDDRYTTGYAYKERVRVVHYPKYKGNVIKNPINSDEYGQFFPYNHYLDILTQSVGDGWIVYLDDDDYFTRPDAIEQMVSAIKSNDTLIYFKAQFNNDRILPSVENWDKIIAGELPKVCNIGGSCIMFHSKYKDQIEWGWWKRGDFRVIKKLHEITKEKAFINDCLTGVQTNPHHGRIEDKIIKETIISEKPKETIMILIKTNDGKILQVEESTGKQLIKTNKAILYKSDPFVEIILNKSMNAFKTHLNAGSNIMEYKKAFVLETMRAGIISLIEPVKELIDIAEKIIEPVLVESEKENTDSVIKKRGRKPKGK